MRAVWFSTAGMGSITTLSLGVALTGSMRYTVAVS